MPPLYKPSIYNSNHLRRYTSILLYSNNIKVYISIWIVDVQINLCIIFAWWTFLFIFFIFLALSTIFFYSFLLLIDFLQLFTLIILWFSFTYSPYWSFLLARLLSLLNTFSFHYSYYILISKRSPVIIVITIIDTNSFSMFEERYFLHLSPQYRPDSRQCVTEISVYDIVLLGTQY